MAEGPKNILDNKLLGSEFKAFESAAGALKHAQTFKNTTVCWEFLCERQNQEDSESQQNEGKEDSETSKTDADSEATETDEESLSSDSDSDN